MKLDERYRPMVELCAKHLDAEVVKLTMRDRADGRTLLVEIRFNAHPIGHQLGWIRFDGESLMAAEAHPTACRDLIHMEMRGLKTKLERDAKKAELAGEAKFS